MRRRSWLIIVALPLILVIGETVYWRIMAERLRAGFQDWVSSRTALGWTARSGAISIGGWPQAATIHVADLVLLHDGPKMPGKLNLTTTDLALSVSLLNPRNLHLFLTRPLHVRVGDVEEIILSGKDISASTRLRQTGPLSMSLHANQLRAEPVTGGWHLMAGLLDAQVEIADDLSQPAATFTVSSEAVALPENVRWPLGAYISSLSVDGRLNGPNPAARDMTHWAEEWRDGGGSLEITHFTMGWGPLGLTSSATLALDEQLQPMGSGNGRIVGYAEALDRFAVGGLLTKSAATAAKAVLSLMAGTTDTG